MRILRRPHRDCTVEELADARVGIAVSGGPEIFWIEAMEAEAVYTVELIRHEIALLARRSGLIRAD